MFHLGLWAVGIVVLFGYGFSTPIEGNSSPEIDTRNDNENDQIVGGVPAEKGEFPFMLVLIITQDDKNKSICGGTFLSSSVVLTAAHCLYSKQSGSAMAPDRVVAYANTLAWDELDDSAVVVNAKDVLIHESYNPKTEDNDIALISLSSPVDNFTPIKLPKASSKPSDYADQKATIAGWGTTAFEGEASTKLLKATVTVLSNKACSKTQKNINNNKLCAAAPGKDSCQGDSGGPLFIGKGKSAIQIGVTSYGKGCANAKYPGVYARVTTYLDWIKTNAANFN